MGSEAEMSVRKGSQSMAPWTLDLREIMQAFKNGKESEVVPQKGRTNNL